MLDRFVDGVRDGEGRTLVIHGEPGVGKTALLDYLRGQVAYDQRRGHDAVRLLLGTARLLEPLNTALARETHLEALTAAVFVGDLSMPGGVREAAEAARAAPPAAGGPGPADVVLDAYALLLTEGYAAAGPALRRALDVLVALDGTSDGRRCSFSPGGEPVLPSPWICVTGSQCRSWPLARFRPPTMLARSCNCGPP